MDGVASSTPGLYDLGWHLITVTTGTPITATKFEVDANGVYFNGLIDDVRLYGAAVPIAVPSRLSTLGSKGAINTTLKTSSLTDGSTLAVHYAFDGADMISNVADRSGNGRTGTLVGSNTVIKTFLTSGTTYTVPSNWNS